MAKRTDAVAIEFAYSSDASVNNNELYQTRKILSQIANGLERCKFRTRYVKIGDQRLLVIDLEPLTDERGLPLSSLAASSEPGVSDEQSEPAPVVSPPDPSVISGAT